uniref:C-type lectin domain-containing protein n=1 Tax=Amphiprion percula TaxID=161767 RepID=A0A3P8UD34_AMPPE
MDIVNKVKSRFHQRGSLKPCFHRGHVIAEFKYYTDIHFYLRYLRTWNDAQTYCRQHYKDLPIIESAEDNANVQAVKPLVDAWIGLYREAWTWSNNQSNSFRNWQFREPDNAFLNEYCVWDDWACDSRRYFICFQEFWHQTSDLTNYTFDLRP